MTSTRASEVERPLGEPSKGGRPASPVQADKVGLPGRAVQDVDRPPHIQSLSEPARTPRPRVHTNALRVVTDPERLDRISGHRSRRRYVRKWAAVWPPERE